MINSSKRGVQRSSRTRTGLTLLAFAAVGALTITGCASGAEGTGEGESAAPYKVAIVADLTGPGASSNGTASEGFRAAIEAANEDGGVNGRQVELTTYDAKSTPDDAQIAARSAVSEEPSAIGFATLSPGVLASQNVLAQAGAPVLAVSVSEELLLPEPQPWYYAGGSTPSQIAQSWLEVLRTQVDELDGAKVALHGLDSNTTNSIFAHFQELLDEEGVEVVTFEKSNGAITSYTAQAQKIVSLGAEAVIAADVLEAFVLVGQSLKDAGFTGAYIGTEGAAADSTFERLAGMNYVGGRAYQSVSEGEAIEAAELVGADASGPYFSAGWALGNIILEGLAACEGDCTAEQMQDALNGVGEFMPPGDVTFGPMELREDKHNVIGVHQYFVWDDATDSVVPFGDPIPVD